MKDTNGDELGALDDIWVRLPGKLLTISYPDEDRAYVAIFDDTGARYHLPVNPSRITKIGYGESIE